MYNNQMLFPSILEQILDCRIKYREMIIFNQELKKWVGFLFYISLLISVFGFLVFQRSLMSFSFFILITKSLSLFSEYKPGKVIRYFQNKDLQMLEIVHSSHLVPVLADYEKEIQQSELVCDKTTFYFNISFVAVIAQTILAGILTGVSIDV